jgi:LytS/YehU family sensor histidine kinase
VISAQAWNDVLELTVKDNGGGLASSGHAASGSGVVLANTHLRLHQLYGTKASLEVTNESRGGVRARLWLPLRATIIGSDSGRACFATQRSNCGGTRCAS